MAVNKVVIGNDTVMDISDTTATASDVLRGMEFYTNAGVKTTGTCRYNADTRNTTATASDVAEGKYFYDSSGVRRVGTMSTSPYSFVGMVVQGTNLSSLADVQAIYGSNTTWQLISSVSLASENVFGNGYVTAMTDGSTLGGLRSRGDNAAPSLYGHLVGYTTQTGVLAAGGMGVPTKTELGSNPEYSGLIADTITVYSWERTA